MSFCSVLFHQWRYCASRVHEHHIDIQATKSIYIYICIPKAHRKWNPTIYIEWSGIPSLLLLFLPLNPRPWNWNSWNSCYFGSFCSCFVICRKVRSALVFFFSSLVVADHFNTRLYISAFRHLLLLLLLLIIIYSLNFNIELDSFALSTVWCFIYRMDMMFL